MITFNANLLAARVIGSRAKAADILDPPPFDSNNEFFQASMGAKSVVAGKYFASAERRQHSMGPFAAQVALQPVAAEGVL